MAFGRPSEYKPEYCDRLLEMGEQGMSKAEMAAELGIAYDTFNRWQNERADFSASVKEAVRRSQAWWEKQGRIATFGGVEGFNATSYIFQMKNRFREEWNDTIRQDHSGEIGIRKVEVQFVRPEAKDA